MLPARPRLYACTHGQHNLVHIDAPLRIERFMQWNAIVQSLGKRIVMHTGNARPFHERMGHAIKRQIAARAPIVLLFAARCPAAIFRAVRAIIVNPLKRHAFGSLSHVGNECLGIGPAFADRDPAPTVMRKCVIFGIVTALPHRKPRCIGTKTATPILIGSGAHVGSTLPSTPLRLAPAGNDFSIPQMRPFDGLHDTAFAPAPPIDRTAPNDRFDCEKAKFLAGQINEFSHASSIAHNGYGVKE